MVCALYIPEVEFANVSTMEPIVLQSVPHDRYNKVTDPVYEFRRYKSTNSGIKFVCLIEMCSLCSLCARRRVISVRTRAERAKQPLEPV